MLTYDVCIVVKGFNPIFGWADINQHNLEGGEPVDILITGPYDLAKYCSYRELHEELKGLSVCVPM